MLTACMILSLVAGLLALISLLPQASSWPCLSVAVLLLAIALFIFTSGRH